MELIRILMTLMLAALLILTLVSLVSMAAWRIVYYGFKCRKAPIQKTALVIIASLWVIFGAFLALL